MDDLQLQITEFRKDFTTSKVLPDVPLAIEQEVPLNHCVVNEDEKSGSCTFS